MWHSLRSLLARLIPKRVRDYFRARFSDTTPSERWGYGIWTAMGIVIGVPEIWSAISGNGFYWPTISTTVGHLQDRWPVLTLIPVALIVIAGYSVLQFKPASTALQADLQAIGRTPYGRLTKQQVTLEQLAQGGPPATDPSRRQINVIPYLIAATLTIIIATLLASQHHDRFLVGYVLYALIGIFWVATPNALAYWWKRDIPYTTLTATVRNLARRLHLVAALVAALLVILLIHLALYPWPSDH